MHKLLLGVLALGIGIGAGGVAFGGGSSSPDAVRAAADIPTRHFHEVSGPAGKATANARVKYFETNVFSIDPDTVDGGGGKCPRGWKAISGYFGEDGDTVVPIYNSVGVSLRRWDVGIRNEDGVTRQAFVGFVCIRATT